MSQPKSLDKVLVVYEESQPWEFIVNTLSYMGYEVFVAGSVDAAKEKILSLDFELIIAEKLLRDGEGFEILNFIRKISTIPFILISKSFEFRDTEGTNLLNFITLYRPFKENELIESLEAFLKRQDRKDFVLNGAREDNVDEEFAVIDIDEFITGREIRYDIFINIGEKRFVKLSHGSESFSEDQIVKLKMKGVKSLYMRKQDFFEYISMTVSLIKHIPKIKISANRKFLFLQSTNKQLTESILCKNVDSQALSHAKTMVESTINMLIGCDEILLTLEFLKNDHKNLFSHSLNVALYSVIIARKLGRYTSTDMASLSAAGMLHDLGKSKIPANVLEIPGPDLSVPEMQLYQSHVMYGLDMLKNVQIVPDIITIVAQHHEDEGGGGYPLGINKVNIHPLSKIMKVADDFCENLQGFIPSIHNIINTLDMMESSGGLKYDQECVAALKACFIRNKYLNAV